MGRRANNARGQNMREFQAEVLPGHRQFMAGESVGTNRVELAVPVLSFTQPFYSVDFERKVSTRGRFPGAAGCHQKEIYSPTEAGKGIGLPLQGELPVSPSLSSLFTWRLIR